MTAGRAVAISAVPLGLALDARLGEPPLHPHPVAAFGQAMSALERLSWRDRRWMGAAHSAVGIGGAVILADWLAGHGSRARHGVRPWLATVAATWLACAGSGLADAARSVATPLMVGDIDTARQRLPALVGRRPDQLDDAEIVRAVVESVAENTVDAVVAPALWAMVGGASGALGYRAVNTLDSMIGHHSPRYERFGWAAARLDDLANWVPARSCALLVMVVRPRRAASVWRVVRRDGPGHPSPNAGVAEAAFAAALGVVLGGRNTYGSRVEVRPSLGDGRPPAVADIEASIALARDCSRALSAVLWVVSLHGAVAIARRVK